MSNVQQLQQRNEQLQQRNDQLQRELNETIQKLRNKESSYDALDAENRRNVAKIGRLESENNRLTQAANRAVCQKCTMRSN
jgi:predicted nuclease with TOPRIM domain